MRWKLTAKISNLQISQGAGGSNWKKNSCLSLATYITGIISNIFVYLCHFSLKELDATVNFQCWQEKKIFALRSSLYFFYHKLAAKIDGNALAKEILVKFFQLAFNSLTFYKINDLLLLKMLLQDFLTIFYANSWSWPNEIGMDKSSFCR